MKMMIAILALAGCAPSWKQGPHPRLFQEEAPRLTKKPSSHDASDRWDLATTLIVAPIGQVLSPGLFVEGIVNGRDALDVNEFGQVPDSSWFENRIGRHRMPPDVARTGAAFDGGPADGMLSVISGKLEGSSAGFVARDEVGTVWFVKLDHPAFPELSTGAEVVASRVLWLAGYHVPSMHIVYVEKSRLVLDPRARGKDRYNRSVPLTQKDLDQLMANTNPDAGGRVRMLMSRKPEGEVLGAFSYRGTRPDDSSDLIDHEHRRSLRGLWVFAAWLNNTDTKDANTLDMFRPVEGNRGFVDHYLIDFGDAFGATGLGEKVAVESWEYMFDLGEVLKNFFTIGLRTPPYAALKRSPFRAVGLFEATLFDPDKWKPRRPNWAFNQRTRADVFWAASILARIQPDHIRAALTSGSYREPGAADHLFKVLVARRSKLIQFGLRGFLPLDRPRMAGNQLRLDDLRALGGLPAVGMTYRVYWSRTRGIDRDLGRGDVPAAVEGEVEIDLAEMAEKARGLPGFYEDPFITVKLSRHGSVSYNVRMRVTPDRIVPVAAER